MATNSATYLQQLEQMGDTPDFKQQVTKAYEDPVLKPLVEESRQLEEQYLPSLFKPFTEMGTEASDLSPAAKLAALGQSIGRLTSRIGSSGAMQNYFGAQIGDIANNLTNQFTQKRQNLLQLYQMAREREEAERAAAERAAAIRAQQAQINAMYGGGGSGSTQGTQTSRPQAKAININPNTGRTSGIGGEIERAIAGLGQGIAGTLFGNDVVNNYIKTGGILGIGDARQKAAQAQQQMQQVTNPDRLDIGLRKNYGDQGAQFINAYRSRTGLSINAALEQLRNQGVLSQLQKAYGTR